MLESILAGTPVSIGLAGWAAYGPALVVFVLAVIALALPQSRRPTLDRRPTHVVTRATDEPSNLAYLPGLLLMIVAAGLLYWGGRPQVVIAADSFTCRPWTRPLLMSEIRSVRIVEVGEPSRTVAELSISLTSLMRRGGVPTRIEEPVIGLLRGRNGIDARGATCPLGGLAVAGREAGALLTVAWGRASLGTLPAADDAAAVEAYCASAPRLGAACAETVRRGAQDCSATQGPTAQLACRYQSALGGAAPAAPRPPAAVPPAAPAAPPAAAPSSRPSTPPPATTPPTVAPTPAPGGPSSPPPASPPSATPPPAPRPPATAPTPSAPAVPGKPPAAPAPAGKPTGS
ncbi:MAG: hypothetical protein JNL66_09360 [Alphaproteobacteria bacterium]|nr:hypothetical protein [Alphaproteobacteria bacterium]